MAAMYSNAGFNMQSRIINEDYTVHNKKTTTKRVLSIDSLFRKNYHTTKSTDFSYILPDPMNKVTSMKI